MPAQLVSLDNDASIMLDKPILLLGRHPECDVQIDSRKISRRHCCIAQVADYLVIRDLGSTNGVRINGARVNEGKIVPGDEITIGNNRYQVTWESVSHVPRPFKAAAVAPIVPDARPHAVPAPPPKHRTIRDSFLEECDSPVPLSDDDDESPIALRTPKSPLAEGYPHSAERPRTNGEEPRILPDNLELAPRSDIFPPGAGRVPSS